MLHFYRVPPLKKKNQILKGLLVTGLILDIEPTDSQVQITAGALNGSEEWKLGHAESSGSFCSVTSISPCAFYIYLILSWTHKQSVLTQKVHCLS